jgi:hypothetical protein
MDHPHKETFESFVIGALSDDESAALVAHASVCDDCAKTLAREAQIELSMFELHAAAKTTPAKQEVARPVATVTRLRPRARALAIGTSALALAAAVVLLVRSRGHVEEPLPSTMTVTTAKASEPIPLTICPDGSEQEKCIEEAHRHGLFVGYPPWASTPPLGGGRAGQGPSGSPFPAQM